MATLDLREVGLSQRLMVWAILTWFIGFFPPFHLGRLSQRRGADYSSKF